MKCSDCKMSDGEFRGSVCPASKITPVTFTGGCTLGKSKARRASDPLPISLPSPRPVKPAKVKQGPTMNSTEREYARTYLAGKDVRFEGYPLKMANGHTYTADFAVYVGGVVVELHEVKGGYTMPSQQRSRLAFDQCRVEYPLIKFIWAKKSKKGWSIK
jgi:hypothetical protein